MLRAGVLQGEAFLTDENPQPLRPVCHIIPHVGQTDQTDHDLDNPDHESGVDGLSEVCIILKLVLFFLGGLRHGALQVWKEPQKHYVEALVP